MNLGQSGDTGEFCLRRIASDKHLWADMLCCSHVDKIPCSRARILGMTGAQFIGPLQQIRNSLDFQPELPRGFTRPVRMPGKRCIIARKSAEVMAEFNPQKQIPNEIGRAFAAPTSHHLRKFISGVKPRNQYGRVCVYFHRRRRCLSCNTGLGTTSRGLTLFCASQTSFMISGQSA